MRRTAMFDYFDIAFFSLVIGFILGNVFSFVFKR